MDQTKCPACGKPWAETKKVSPPAINPKKLFSPCELLHGDGGTASVYADLAFAFLSKRFPEWVLKGKDGITETLGEDVTWEEFCDSLELPDQEEGDTLTETQESWLRNFDEELERRTDGKG